MKANVTDALMHCSTRMEYPDMVSCNGCPYHHVEPNCWTQLFDDTLRLIRAQERMIDIHEKYVHEATTLMDEIVGRKN